MLREVEGHLRQYSHELREVASPFSDGTSVGAASLRLPTGPIFVGSFADTFP